MSGIIDRSHKAIVTSRPVTSLDTRGTNSFLREAQILRW